MKLSKYNILVCDCPWVFSDRLTMSKVKRGAASNYQTLSDIDIINLPVQKIIAKDALLALWVPSSKLQIGLDCMKAWGFVQKQTWIWVKTKQVPLRGILGKPSKTENRIGMSAPIMDIKHCRDKIENFDLNDTLSFGMGRLFRQTHELVLIGTRGKIYNKIKNKAQRSVYFWPATKHSTKPEGLQDMIDIMFPSKALKRIEMFARRDRKGYLCVGNECPSTMGLDIRDFLNGEFK